MTTFLMLAAALAALTLLVLTRPLWHAAPHRTPAIDDPLPRWREQLHQLDGLHAAGALGDPAHAEARAALERQIGAHVAAAVPASAAAARRPLPRRLIGTIVAMAMAVLIGGYSWLGDLAALDAAPPTAGAMPAGHPSLGPEAATAGDPAAPHELGREQIAGMTERLAARLQQQPDDAAGWAMLARSYAVTGRHDQAVPAFRQASKRQPDDAMLLADFADALAMTQQRRLDGEPIRLVRRALELQPDNPKALFLAGTEAFDRGDPAGALAHWEHLRDTAPADNPMRRQVLPAIDEARTMAGAPAAPAARATPDASATAGTAATATVTASAKPSPATLAGLVTLSPALRAQAAPDDTVFVFARAAEGGRMPLAITRHRVRDLPLRFTLDDRHAMSPAARLSALPRDARVVVGARVSRSGQAQPQPGDLQGLSPAIAPGSGDLRIEIDQAVTPPTPPR
ncbi:c-type cytochrome biogenesis protein CcmI [Aquabacterium humicola]|uniref:c-type cytochrome biogenesis protein CcmI n=1 Tax=Aquabacterium humicola TaxID=3237377 RepID=UPI0025426CF1|nr:c-type cytochrome biogenesis protein CcmI [Rubrivivax pictus]